MSPHFVLLFCDIIFDKRSGTTDVFSWCRPASSSLVNMIIGRLHHIVQTVPTHLCTCALVFGIKHTDILHILCQKLGAISLCVRARAPVLCFLAIDSGGLEKQVAESNSQQMPSERSALTSRLCGEKRGETPFDVVFPCSHLTRHLICT